MTTWWHHPTILNLRFDRRLALRVSCILLLCIALITTLFYSAVAHAAPGVNKTIGFQGRLLDANGDIVPNGSYNIQFKIYQDGVGTAAGNPSGTLKWTETYINNGSPTGAVEVKNGFLSINLGSLNPFGTSVDWNQDTLWLSMNIAGASTSCTTFGTAPCAADGEMLPMKRMTATPYALNSGQLGGIGSSGYIKNSTAAQTADLNITGSATANAIQGGASVQAPAIDSISSSGTLTIGAANALTINIGRSSSANSTINIGTGTGTKTLTLGTTSNSSSTILQGGSAGVRINTRGGLVVNNSIGNYNPFEITDTAIIMRLGTDSLFAIKSASTDRTFFSVNDSGDVTVDSQAALSVQGSATFQNGITIQGSSGITKYTSPLGSQLGTAINIPNYTVGNFGSVLALGLPATSSTSARGILVADARTSVHQATIGVVSPDENAIMGLTWNGSNSVGTLSNTANSLSLRGNSLEILTATNNGGAANVGIGNSAAAGYALDVTGDINTSTALRVGGVSTLNNSSLAFSGASASTITSANSQSLNLNGKTGVTVQNDGATIATFSGAGVQIGDGIASGDPTVLTIDKATAAPSVGSSILGSMYYDTTKGKVQCYEADGWGTCSANPDNFVTLSPQYSNAVMHTLGTGTMTSDFCSDTLDINDGTSSQPTVCGTGETNNYYNWTSPSSSIQTRSIYVTYKLPSNFGGFVSGSTSLKARTDSVSAYVSWGIYRNTGSSLLACGTGVLVSTGVKTTWQTGDASTQDPASCSFVAGESVVFKINLDARLGGNSYLGDLNFAFKNSGN